jgi:hypothetical protein
MGQRGAHRTEQQAGDAAVSAGGIVAATREIAPSYWRRHLALAVDGLRTAAAWPLPEPPLDPAQHRRAMKRLASRR